MSGPCARPVHISPTYILAELQQRPDLLRTEDPPTLPAAHGQCVQGSQPGQREVLGEGLHLVHLRTALRMQRTHLRMLCGSQGRSVPIRSER